MVDAIGRFAPGTSSAAGAVNVLTRLLDPKYRVSYEARSFAAEKLGSFGGLAVAAIPKLQALQGDDDTIRSVAAASISAIEADSKLHHSGGNAR